MKGSNSNVSLESNTSLQEELELLLLQEQQHNRRLILERERDLDINRSGSAPPSVEGALRSNIFGNPNFVPFEDSSSSSSNYIARTGVLTEEEIRSHPAYLEYYYSNENLNPRLPPPLLSREDWRVAQRLRAGGDSSLFSVPPCFSGNKTGEDEFIGLRKAALRNISRKNSTEMLDKTSIGSGGPASGSGLEVRRKSFVDIVQEGLGQQVKKMGLSRPTSQNLVAEVAESSDAMFPEKTFANARNGAMPDAPKVPSSGIFEIADYSGSFSGLSMSKGQIHPEDILKLSGMLIGQNQQQQHYIDMSRAEMLLNSMNYANLTSSNGSMGNLHNSYSLINDHLGFTRRTSSTSNLQSLLNPSDFGNNFPDPHYIQYIRGRNLSECSSQDKFVSSPPGFGNMQALEKAYHDALLLQQKHHQYQSQLISKPSSVNDYYSNFYDPPETSRSSLLQKEKAAQTQSPPTLRTHTKGESKNVKGRFESMLDLVKSNNTKSLELSDVLTHVLEFSTDQYGSRFIQQKLETATVEEKTKIFREIVLHARALIIDVFGNYVIQKFFEHGTDDQRKELAGHVIGHVLPLSLQMYGCRVIQKALEVVDVELQAEMVKELDGSVMKCVRDQNGNHVIQKCIECVPQHLIQFITSSFVGNVVTLSTHPYGCRVIQRVLEHCADPKTQQLIMDEILSSVCNLAQDQYGNYVIQHVLQHGKPHERSVIIRKLAGQIVKMSQQKFASNVVEKCLTFCGPEERKLLVNEILGCTDENEPLQAMMKDPFGNYVVQKVLETCDDQNRELILSRIKVHLNTLKKYTYGKHIVSRIEKLVATGERQAVLSSPRST